MACSDPAFEPIAASCANPPESAPQPIAPAASPSPSQRRIQPAHTRSLQGSKDSSSDTPSDHASAGASSATSLALEPDIDIDFDAGGASAHTSPSKACLPALPPLTSPSGGRSSPTPSRVPSVIPDLSSTPGERYMQRSASQRSTAGPSASQRRLAYRRTSLNYVSGAPPLSRSSSLIADTRGEPASASEWSRVRTGLSKTPSTSSAASASGRPSGRSSSLRYSHSGKGTGAALSGLGLGLPDDSNSTSPARMSTVSRPAGPAAGSKRDSLLNPVRQAAFEGDTLVSRSHDLLSDIAARERTLLDLKEEVKKQEKELESLRQRWQQSVTSTIANDAPVGSSSPGLTPSSPNPSEPARQAADTIRGWSGKLGSLFDSTSLHAPPAEATSAPVPPTPSQSASVSGSSQAGNPRTARHAKRSSIFGMMFAPTGDEENANVSGPATQHALAKPEAAEDGSVPGTVRNSEAGGPASGWWSRTWKPRTEPASSKPDPASTNACTPSRGPRIENGIVVDNVEEGQPMRIFLEELIEEDEAGDRDESPPVQKRDLPALPLRRDAAPVRT